jgi:hypothetical protein
MILLVGMLALLSPSCNGCTCPLTSDRIMNCSDGSQAILYTGTDILPTCHCMSAAWIGDNLPDPGCLPVGDVITAIDITPDGAEFTLDGLLHFKLPAGHGYAINDTLTVWQHTAGTCGGSSSPWIEEPGHATVVAGDFADGPLRHTTVFALVDMGGRIGTLGRLVTPFEQQNGDIVFDVEVLVSSTQRELEGQVLTIVIAGIEGEPEQLMVSLSKIPVGSVFAFQWDDNSDFTVWWQGMLIRFYAQDVFVR